MYAIIKTGGKQYRVAPNDVLDVELLKADQGDTVEIDEVLAIGDGDEFLIGTPYVEGASVKAEVLEHGKGDKVIVYKYKPKKDYHKKQGHRQKYSRIKVLDIVK